MTTYKKLMTKAEKFYWRTLWLLMVANLVLGIGFFIEAFPLTAPGYTIALGMAPRQTWGLIALSAAALFCAGIFTHRHILIVLGLAVGGFFINVFALTFLLAAFEGMITGFTGIVMWLLVGSIHLIAARLVPLNLPANHRSVYGSASGRS